jgi:Ca2+-binding RTX toxin-like protein
MAFDATFNLATLNGSNGFTLQGIRQGIALDLVASGAGDINGDGIADFILGSPFADPNGVNNAGESYVFFGSSGIGQGGNLTPALLDGSNGFVLEGIATGDLAGTAVSSAGDVNNDGIDDLLIGAPFATRNRRNFAGESYVVFGRRQGFSSRLNLADLNGSNGFVLNGPSIDDDLVGASVSDLGDINGDGIDDFIVSAPRARPDGRFRAGTSYVIFGSSGLGGSGRLDLTTLNGSNGFVIQGINPVDQAGTVVSSAGDLNGDGINDLLIAAPFAVVNGVRRAGEAYVVFGDSGVGNSGSLELADLNGLNGFVIEAVDSGSSLGGLGTAISSAGDLNGDGIDDILIADPSADINGIGGVVGKVHVLFGDNDVGSTGRFQLANVDGSNGFVINGASSIDEWGSSVSALGDFNGDGWDDIIIAPDLGAGNYVIYGNPTIGSGGSLNLPNGNSEVLPATDGLFLFENAAFRIIGGGVSGVGDINGDGLNDLITLSDTFSTLAQAYVVFGDGAPTEEPPNLCGCDGGVDADLLRIGDAGDNMIKGSNQDDILAGGLGNDILRGCDGDDVLRGDRNSRSEQAGEPGGDDTIYGGAGNDRIGGKSGNDILFGEEGDDQIWGDGGDDIINGGSGNDILYGDSRRTVGADTFILVVGEGTDTIMDYNKGGVIDTIQVLGTTAFATLQQGNGTLIMAGEETLAILAGFTGEVTFA